MNTLTLLSDALLQELRADVFAHAISLIDFDYLVQIDAELKRRAQEQSSEFPPVKPAAFWRVALPIMREKENEAAK